MKCLECYTAASLEDAFAYMKQHSKDVMLVAGATDVVVKARRKDWYADKYLLQIGEIPELKYIREKDGVLSIGAATTISELLESEAVRKHAGILWEACRGIAGPQVRNAATIGGNLGNACLAGDTIPALCVLRAEIKITGPDGEKQISVSELLKKCPACLKHEELNVSACYYGCPAGKKTILSECEIITEIRIPVMDETYKFSFRKIGDKQMGCMSKFTIALAVQMDGEKTGDVRLAYGSAFADIREQVEAEKKLTGITINDIDKMQETADELADTILAQQKAADENLRYRAEVCRRLTVRTLKEMMQHERD